MGVNWKVIRFNENIPPSRYLDRLDEKPAIYFFYKDLSSIIRREKAIEALREMLVSPHGAKYEVNLGFYEKAKVYQRQVCDFSYVTEEKLASITSRSPEFEEKLTRLVASLEFCIPPLYVGETENLKKRMKAHFLGQDGFMKRASDDGIDLSMMLIRYFYLDEAGMDLFKDVMSSEHLDEEVAAADDDDDVLQILLRSRSKLPDKPVDDSRVFGEALNFIEEYVSRLVMPRYLHKLGEKVLRGTDE